MAARGADRFDTTQSWLQRSQRLLHATILGLVLAIFVADYLLHESYALSVLYTVPILFSLWLDRRRYTVGLAIACVMLDLVDVFHDGDPRATAAIVNRATALLTITIVTSMGLMRLRSERELRYVRKIALTTLRSIGEAVITINNLSRVRFVNRAAERLLGVRRAELVGRALDDVFPIEEEHAPRAPVVELATRGVSMTTEALLRTHDGRRTPIEINRTMIQTRTGQGFGFVLVFRDVSARKEHEEAMRRMAYRDELTGLPNRTALADRIALELAHAKRNRESLAVLYLDLDGFKEVNDRFEHAVGDAVLVEVAERMRSALRAGDTIARLGGDEFVVLLPAVSGTSDARRVGEKILEALARPVACLGQPVTVGASIGIAMYPKDGAEAETLIRRADKAMYRAKQLGRSRVEMHAGVDALTA